MLDALRQADRRVVGVRQVLKAIAKGSLSHVFIARDADPFVTRPVFVACEKARIPVTEVPSQEALGEACGIAVNASVAGLQR